MLWLKINLFLFFLFLLWIEGIGSYLWILRSVIYGIKRQSDEDAYSKYNTYFTSMGSNCCLDDYRKTYEKHQRVSRMNIIVLQGSSFFLSHLFINVYHGHALLHLYVFIIVYVFMVKNDTFIYFDRKLNRVWSSVHERFVLMCLTWTWFMLTFF